MTEDQLQAVCWQWVWNEFPECRRLLWAVPNGGDRNIVVAIKLMATGVLPGVHDLHLFWKGEFITFEMKVGNNKLTEDRLVVTPSGKQKIIFGQREWGAKIVEHGGRWYEVREVEQFKNLFRKIIRGV